MLSVVQKTSYYNKSTLQIKMAEEDRELVEMLLEMLHEEAAANRFDRYANHDYMDIIIQLLAHYGRNEHREVYRLYDLIEECDDNLDDEEVWEDLMLNNMGYLLNLNPRHLGFD
jgi:tRNA(Phe) wybutosine-synthesizing methylase Tyw3